MIVVLCYFFYGTFAYLTLCTLHFVTVTIAGRLRKEPHYAWPNEKRRIAVLIPCYKEDGIIAQTVAAAKFHDYPESHFDVFVIADSMRPETLQKLKAMDVTVIPVAFDISTKSKSIHTALEVIDSTLYDIAFVLDADNVMSLNCLEKVNAAFHCGVRALQCHRVAKNMDTPVAVLESINEEINNYIFRRGHRALGVGSSSAGSGMAFEFGLLKEIFNSGNILNDTGEDKEIDLQLLKKGIVMEYISDAYIYDEKTPDAKGFSRQRLRWIEAHLSHLRRLVDKDIRSLPKDRHLLTRIISYLILPRTFFLMLVCSLIGVAVLEGIFHFDVMDPDKKWWIAVIALYFLSLLLAFPAQHFNTKTLWSMLSLFSLGTAMFFNVFRMRLHRKEFIHTEKKVMRT
ncbi:glycosyltransferase [Chryseolinea lacunae]|uniref:Glycosyltransferase n=1 Tax=Chryseolinea lacunae TaxID=2801331 RepID=A0ABS1KJT3_9BACT|nr:glycosyltransferase family 2 protein [Chryseolinea lacunae]MBL0739719.1 glycosyltransferase [Chryseolinea lacunae]